MRPFRAERRVEQLEGTSSLRAIPACAAALRAIWRRDGSRGRVLQSVSRTQDFGLNDSAVAVFGEALGHKKEAEYLRERAMNYRNLWNKKEGVFCPRFESGALKTGLNHESGHGDYTECSPDTSIWSVPYDMPGIVQLLGSL